MPAYQAPGVYIEESPHLPPTIEGSSTSVTAFVGYTQRGPDNVPTRVTSAVDFERLFGPPTADSELSFAVQHYFDNGGQQAVIVRTPARYNSATPQRNFTIDCGDPALGLLSFTAQGSGDWANHALALLYTPGSTADTFSLTITDAQTPPNPLEVYRNLSLDAASPSFIVSILSEQSQIFTVRANLPSPLPTPAALFTLQQVIPADPPAGPSATADILGDRGAKTGLYALLAQEDISLLCLPDATRTDPKNAACPDPSIDSAALYAAAVAFCEERGIFLLVDPPVTVTSVATAQTWHGTLQPLSRNAAAYLPRIVAVDPTQKIVAGQPQPTRTYAPCGYVAGILARTDAQRGVWKAPAGTSATLTGALDLTVHFTDPDNTILGPLNLNLIRNLVPYGTVVWGARVLLDDNEWRYISVRRFGLFLERSLTHGTAWAVFEPNTQPTWTRVVTSIENFLYTLYRAGALQGAKPTEAYFVRCGLNQTMTQLDVQEGRLIVELGFAPIKPAEFIILRFTQMVDPSS